jgi:hypothetical protein
VENHFIGIFKDSSERDNIEKEGIKSEEDEKFS